MHQPIKPFLKWAGGKTQLLPQLKVRLPTYYGQYIEPFVGGGALFFHLRPRYAIISDANAELINTYKIVQNSLDALIEQLAPYPNTKDFFYNIRAQDPTTLSEIERAARFIYLNRTCYNGLYRVNKQGQFNVPFGNYTNPTICDTEQLRAAHDALQGVQIHHGDYHAIVNNFARTGDFVFFDPPYQPSSLYSDFKRYTPEFFYEADQIKLAETFKALVQKGVYCLLTNSNTEFIRDLYNDFPYEIIATRRNINAHGDKRLNGEDLIVFATQPPRKTKRHNGNYRLIRQFPGTRFMGSKYNILPFIEEALAPLAFDSALDAFSGSTSVAYLLKALGKKVYTNDLLHFSYYTADALIANPDVRLDEDDLQHLLTPHPQAPTFIQDTFQSLYFSDGDNRLLDHVRTRINELDHPHKKALALGALVRACLKKRPRGIFTYTGERYNDNRPDMRLSLQQHFINAVHEFNEAVFDNHQENQAFCGDVFALDVCPDLVYIDPPYYTPNADSDYLRRYHFVEGLVRYWEGVEIQAHTQTKKFAKYPTRFEGKESTYQAFQQLFEKFKESILVVSYSSNGLPSKSEIVDMLRQHKRQVTVLQIGHQYSFGTQYAERQANAVYEYLFIGV